MNAFEFALTCAFIVSMMTFIVIQIRTQKKEEAERLKNKQMSEYYQQLSRSRYQRILDARYKQTYEDQMLAAQKAEIAAKAKAIPKQKKNTLPKI